MKWYTPTFKKAIWAFVIIVVVVAIFMMISDVSAASKKLEKFDEPKVKITLFHATWCGHCVKYLKSGVFMDTYKNSVQSNPALAGKVVFVQLDYDENKEAANKFGVSSFPTIVAISNDDKLIAEFKGDRTSANDLVKFATDSLAKS